LRVAGCVLRVVRCGLRIVRVADKKGHRSNGRGIEEDIAQWQVPEDPINFN
jgi:hypothetical protein